MHTEMFMVAVICKAKIQPGQGLRAVVNEYREEVPVRFNVLPPEQMEFAAEWTTATGFADMTRRVYTHGGRFFRSFDNPDGSPASVHDYADRIRRCRTDSVFGACGSRNLPTLDEIAGRRGTRILDIQRDHVDQVVTEALRKVFVVDGKVYELASEPVLNVTYDGTPRRVALAVGTHSAKGAVFPLSMLDEAREFGRHLAQVAVVDFKDAVGSLTVAGTSFGEIDTRAQVYRCLRDQAAAAFALDMRDMSDEAVEAALTLRRGQPSLDAALTLSRSDLPAAFAHLREAALIATEWEAVAAMDEESVAGIRL